MVKRAAEILDSQFYIPVQETADQTHEISKPSGSFRTEINPTESKT